jgi:hypothetical protein
MTYLVHGEPHAARALATSIHERLGWATHVPHDGEVVSLEPRDR